MPAAIETKSGIVAAPDQMQANTRGSSYGGSRTASSDDASFRLDNLTTRPSFVEYDEPFRPSILPFKRMYAYDAVAGDGRLMVRDAGLIELAVGGEALPSEDVFFADFDVELVENVPVRIPSVGPGASIRALELSPSETVRIEQDGAGNWFARSPRSGKVRFLMQLSIERQTFGSHFLPVGWATLEPFVPKLPQAARGAAQLVLAHIGVSHAQTPAGALRALVDYFRAFQESAELPQATDPFALYSELSLHQKGVCRHRAFGFVVTALALGIPTRLVSNEAHAWVEVFDSELWHRIDLGGAPSELRETRQDPTLVHHRPPSDPFSWPAQSQPASTAFAERLQAGSGVNEGPSISDPSSSGTSHGSQTSASSGNADPTPNEAQSGQGASQLSASGQSTRSSGVAAGHQGSDSGAVPSADIEIELTLKEAAPLRGTPISVLGRVLRKGRPCQHARVDIFIESARGSLNIGSVATTEQGHFSGQVTLPANTAVGPLRLSARLAAGCETL